MGYITDKSYKRICYNCGGKLVTIQETEKGICQRCEHERTSNNISKIFNPFNKTKRIEKEISDMIKDKR